MTDEPNIKNDDRLAGGGDFDVIAFLDRELAATGAQSYDSTAEGLMRTKGYIAALRQRCEQAEADAGVIAAALVQAERERDEAVADARRYRWLCAGENASVSLRRLPPIGTQWPDTLDAAIDAALAHDAQEKK